MPEPLDMESPITNLLPNKTKTTVAQHQANVDQVGDYQHSSSVICKSDQHKQTQTHCLLDANSVPVP